MKQTQLKECIDQTESGTPQASLPKRLARLFLAVSLVLFFILYLGPAMQNNRFFRPIALFIEERGIDASALYYTEIEEFSEADVNMNSTMDYMPQDNTK